MKNRTTRLIGSILIAIGFFSIVDALFNINLWSLILPLLLIAIGFFILFRPKSLSDGSDFILRFINEIDEFHANAIKPAEYLSFVSDIKFDLSGATIPDGETTIRFNSFVNEIKITLPQNAGLKISARGIVTNTKLLGKEEDNIFAPFEYASPNYEIQTHKVFIQLLSFVSEIEINGPGLEYD